MDDQHSFHGHEAPNYGRGNYQPLDRSVHWGLSWKPRYEIVGDAPERGALGANARALLIGAGVIGSALMLAMAFRRVR